jgi:hypothetical protein
VIDVPKFHFISGLPRSGSTLLSAILRQNPRFHAGISSSLCPLFTSTMNVMAGEGHALIGKERRENVLRGLFAFCIAGWAQSVEHPEAPVCLDIFAGGKLIGQVLANRYRKDLAQAGIGTGHHGFEFAASLDLSAHTIDVRRSLDGAVIERAAENGSRIGRSAPLVRVHRRAARA